MPSPRVISLDCETYGAFAKDAYGTPLPPQTTFHPRRSLHTDGVSLSSLVQTVSLTIPTEDPRCPASPPARMEASPSTSSPQQTLPASSPPSSTAAATTTPTPGPSSTVSWSGSLLSGLRPWKVMVLHLWNPNHQDLLASWLKHADTLIGMNLAFDLTYLRAIPRFRLLLDRRHFVIDVSVLNYLHSEMRTARSLKDQGPVLGSFTYADDLLTLKKGDRFPSPRSPRADAYVAADSWNALLACAGWSRRILTDFGAPPCEGLSTGLSKTPPPSSSEQPSLSSSLPPSSSPSSLPSRASSALGGTSKLSPFCLQFYNDTIWSVIRMTEAGIPMDASRLSRLHALLASRASRARDLASAEFGLILEGTGSALSQRAFIDTLITTIDTLTGPVA